jgi:hypothetical protein
MASAVTVDLIEVKKLEKSMMKEMLNSVKA